MFYLYYILAGAVIGAANVIPGVSGGTMAVLFGIYDKLLDAISLSIKKLKKNILFILTVGFGLIAGIFLFAKAITFLLENYKLPTQFFFMGLILGSFPLVWRLTVKHNKFRKINIVPLLICVGLLFAYSFLEEGSSTVQTELNVKLMFVLFISAFIATVAMLIPGVSGSFLLKAIGMYDTVTTAVSGIFDDGKINTRCVALLIPFGVGAIAGLLVGAKIISTLLKKYYQGVYAAIIGMIFGSLFIIYPGGFRFNAMGFYSILCLICGAVISLSMGNMEKNKSQDEE